MRKMRRELKVAVARLKAGTAEKNISNFPNPSRLPAYENIGGWRRKQENQTWRRRKAQEGFEEMREAEVRRFDEGWERSSVREGGDREEQSGRRGCKRVEYRTLNWRE